MIERTLREEVAVGCDLSVARPVVEVHQAQVPEDLDLLLGEDRRRGSAHAEPRGGLPHAREQHEARDEGDGGCESAEEGRS